jgi:hypothetical protein
MPTKLEVLALLKRAKLTKISADYIDQMLDGLVDEDNVPREKLSKIAAIVKSEVEANSCLEEACKEAMGAWKDLYNSIL